MGTLSKNSSKITQYGTVRDLLLAEIALSNDLLTTENLDKGVAVLEEMAGCGITSGLFNVLADRGLFDRARIRDLLKHLDTAQISCPRCRKGTSLHDLSSKDRFHCESCNSFLEVSWNGPDIDLSSDDSQNLAAYLEAKVLTTDEPSNDAPVSGGKVKKMGAFDSARSQSVPVAAAAAPSPAKPVRRTRKKTTTHYPETSPQETEKDNQASSKTPYVIGRTNVEKVDVRKLVTNYKVEGVLHSGPYGRTYHATSDESACKVIKVLSPDRAPNRQNHDQLAAALNQWATVNPERPGPSHTLEKKGDAALILRPYIEEPFASLADFEFGDGSHRLRVLQIIARDLACIHSSGHCHGNLKPSNIFVRLSNTSGEAQFVDPALHMMVPQTNDIERWKVLINAPRFRSPEEIRGEPLTSASDIYALGWVFYTVLTGKLPFTGEERPEILRRHLDGPCPQLGKDAGLWHSLIESMTALDAGERPQSAADIVALIQQIAGKKALKLSAITPRRDQNDLGGKRENIKARGTGLFRYALGPLFLAAALGLVGWTGYEWQKISTAFASSNRDRDVYHQVAEEAFYRTREDARSAPEKAPELWDRYRESFSDTPFDGAAAAEKRNFESATD